MNVIEAPNRKKLPATTYKNLTKGAWIFGCPDPGDRMKVKMELLVSKKLYGRFLAALQNDKEIAAEVISSLAYDKMESWLGQYADVAEPEVFAHITSAALDKHLPLRKVRA